MGIFGKNKYKDELNNLKIKNEKQANRINELEDLCHEKDLFFDELMSDATRHGSSIGAKHMSDKARYLKNK